MRFNFAILMALGAFACGDGTDGDNTNNCDDCVDNTNEGCENCPDETDTEMGTLVVQGHFDGSSVDTTVNVIDGGSHTEIGYTGDVIDREVGEEEYCLGPTTKTTSDGIPVIEHDEWQITSSTFTASVSADTETPKDVTFNVFMENRWSCWNSDSDSIVTGGIEMREGRLVDLPLLTDDMVIGGKSVTFEDTDQNRSYHGTFETPTFISLEWTIGAVEGIAECWKGEEGDRPN